ncbi:3-hydroxyacyl-CoA dehydrogenase/enoyl-CoA hydratase family protein [Desulfofundulus salinus]|uniref:3-hydroxyacyl-CoA dehydrogenase/enoyl-CoA hydratase family protein n=1 Tax=Desulfofundulus salinus TaxID=2419843 RepID=A0A494X3J9_9FIRM|nr:3-hydroxyacyl-CoA dehydrogenase/enoyl-CoA hydratase family protein [Desulfofundulus salinum]RKO67787.1 3-hydroxyacyl-CoA dehydrogenase/enoyl-CoA hydratase family protein [Desulfofundulus salinum]
MRRRIRKAAVLGAGVMGAAIAGHLANAGIPTYLLDIVPGELTPEEAKQGLTLEHPRVRNRLATKAIEQLVKAKPAPLYLPENAELITPGNLEDHLDRLAEVDWIIEVVVERLDIKQNLLARVEKYRRPGTIVSSNTSGLSINKMVEGRQLEFRQHFLGTHFFNPPRYMRLLEIIPGRDTLPEIVDFMKDFGERVLGKGVVICKDTPNFIANRIGVYGMCATIRAMLDTGLTVEEVDALTGRALLRPKSASFRTLDMVGLDVLAHVARNMYEAVDDPAEKKTFTVPDFLKEMVARGWLGDKTGQGFYKKVKGPAGTEIQVLDYRTLEYRPRQKARFPSLEMARTAGSPDKQLQALLFGKDKGAQFAWRITKEVLVYAASKLPEIAGDIQSVDEAMKWGFNWDLGPFELWDAIGVPRMVERLKAEGEPVPPVVEELLAAGRTSFYEKREGIRYIFDWRTKESRQEHIPEGVIFLAPLKEQNRVVKSNSGASLIDLGDGVLCLEFHSRANAIGGDIVQMINYAVKEVEQNYEGLVIGNYGRHFSVGANLMLILMEAEDEEWDELDLMIREFQQANMKLKFCSKPVVAAPHSMAVGGGCEVCLHCHRVNAHAETYMGLVEVGVGLLPAGGGCKEMVLRAMERQTPETQIKVGGINTVQPLINRAFETIAMARVSTSGPEAVKLGYLRPTDRITTNRDRVIGDAKNLVLEMARRSFRPPRPATIPAVGTAGYAALQLAIETLRWGNQITEHDARIAKKIAYVLTGGGVTPGTPITEQDLLDLEREAFLSLLGEPKTIERIRHMLATNKPLRN